MEYLKVSQVAKKTKTSKRTVYSWINSGKLRAFKIHIRGTVVAEPDLDKFMEEFFLIHTKQRSAKLINI